MGKRYMFIDLKSVKTKDNNEIFYINVLDKTFSNLFKCYVKSGECEEFVCGDFIDEFIDFRLDFKTKAYVPCFKY